ncbi:hypothetical protein AGMMS50239_17980 [Bacteroidia bacterium]|nr:hypothetical protein AGMMS50239_17980 [Bacteroidia bacterium]
MLVAGIGKDKYFYKEVKGIAYLFNNSLENEYIKNDFEIDSSLKYLSHYRIPELTKHYKPLVSMALEDIFNVAESPIALPKLVKIVFELFDQGEVSLSVLAEKHGLAKSTLHHKTESFKKKIIENYIPDTEDDGINFLQNLSAALNELAK